MPAVPQNNLIDRLEKLGYNARLINIVAPQIQTTFAQTAGTQPKTSNACTKIPEIVNLDDWSDFEDD